MRKVIALLILCSTFAFTSNIHAQTNPGVNNAELNGSYAFAFDGFSGNGTVSSAFAVVGRLTADGAGNLTNGELAMNSVGGVAVSAQSFIGTYAIGADNRGVMTLNAPSGTLKMAFAMTAGGSAQIIEFDASGGAGRIGSGTMEKADATAYSAARITGDYAIGAAGFDNVNSRAAIEGRFTSNGTGALTNAAGDVNAYGTAYSMVFSATNYSVSSTTTGRGTLHLAFSFGGVADTLNFVFYIVNSGKSFVMESDVVSPTTPLLNGVMVQQQTPASGFSNSSLNGNMVIYLGGTSVCGSGATGIPKAVAGLLTTNGNGALSLTYDENYCRAPNSVTGAAGTYSVASNGRTSMMIGGYSLVTYLVNANQMMLFVSDANVLFGFGESQTAVSANNGGLKGPYAGSASHPMDFATSVFSGEFFAAGAAPTGNLSGAEDVGAASGPVSGAAFNATYSITASPTNGRGTMAVASGTGGNAIIYMISATKFIAVSMTDPNPSILVFEQSPATAPSIAISSLSLNPASVTGGNSSTGTMTLSGPAPAGGAVVSLSSNNVDAKVPSTVTISADSTSSAFAITTTAVSASIVATISANYGGATKSAALTVSAPPPPPPSLSSLTLNPASVLGGLQATTATVSLTRAAPAGGALVLLIKSGPASVPSSVLIPEGAKSASFPVSSSLVLLPSSASISASYNGATRTAILTILL